MGSAGGWRLICGWVVDGSGVGSPFVTTLVFELGHEDRSDPGDGPANTDVAAAVYLPHHAFEDVGADVGPSFEAGDGPAGVGVGQEREDLPGDVSEMDSRGVAVSAVEGVGQGVEGFDGVGEVLGGPGVAEELVELGAGLVDDVRTRSS